MKKCFECDAPAQADHHVVPKVLGGTKTIPLCDDCHSKVHDTDMLKMASLIRKQRRDAGPPIQGGKYWGGKRPYGFDVIDNIKSVSIRGLPNPSDKYYDEVFGNKNYYSEESWMDFCSPRGKGLFAAEDERMKQKKPDYCFQNLKEN